MSGGVGTLAVALEPLYSTSGLFGQAAAHFLSTSSLQQYYKPKRDGYKSTLDNAIF